MSFFGGFLQYCFMAGMFGLDFDNLSSLNKILFHSADITYRMLCQCPQDVLYNVVWTPYCTALLICFTISFFLLV